MLPEDIQDLVIALILIIALAVFVPFLGFSAKNYASQIPDVNDESKLFLINYLKTETGDGQIADLIALNEGSDHATLIPLQTLSKKIINFYYFRNRNYILRKLENHDRKELVDVESYTIEHIMPQNPKLSEEWIKDLGENIREK